MSIVDSYKEGVVETLGLTLSDAITVIDGILGVAEDVKEFNPELSNSILRSVTNFHSIFKEIAEGVDNKNLRSINLSDHLVYSDLILFSRLVMSCCLLDENEEYIKMHSKSILNYNDVIAQCLLRELYLNKLS